MRPTASALALLLALLGGVARAEDPDPVAALRSLLDAYDHRAEGEMTDTIPLEKAILAVADAGKADALVEFAGHERFGPLAFTVACEAQAPGATPGAKATAAQEGLRAAFVARPVAERGELAVAFAALRTDAVRAALADLAAQDEIKAAPVHAARVRAARLRAGDATVVAEARKALGSKDPDEAAQALLALGDSHSPDFLPDVVRLTGDSRRLKNPPESAWPATKTTTSADGLTTTSQQVPVPLPTVGDVALEAADRLCASPLPNWVAWWAWPEKGARFDRTPAGLAALRAFAVEDAKAAKASGPRAVAAVAAVLHHVRRTEEGAECRLVSVAFDKSWTVTLMVGNAKRTATVDAAGKVALK